MEICFPHSMFPDKPPHAILSLGVCGGVNLGYDSKQSGKLSYVLLCIHEFLHLFGLVFWTLYLHIFLKMDSPAPVARRNKTNSYNALLIAFAALGSLVSITFREGVRSLTPNRPMGTALRLLEALSGSQDGIRISICL